MALVTANGIPVSFAHLFVPRMGAWQAELEVDAASIDQLDGAVSLEVAGGSTWKGTRWKPAAMRRGAARVRILGGAAGLMKDTEPKLRQRVQARAVATALLDAAGEKLSSTADSATLGVVFPRYQIVRQPVQYALGALVKILGASWRILADGTVWIGPEKWGKGELGDAVEIDREPMTGKISYAVTVPTLLPGTEIDDGRVTYVEHKITAEGSQTTAYFDEGGAGPDRIATAVYGLVRAATATIDYDRPYRAKVKGQSSDLTKLDVLCDDARLGEMPELPLRHGVPGLTVKVAAGAYVIVQFMNGDPRFPYVSNWEGGESVNEFRLDADVIKLNGGGTPVAIEGSKIESHVHPYALTAGPYPVSGTINAPAVQPGIATGEGVASVKAG